MFWVCFVHIMALRPLTGDRFLPIQFHLRYHEQIVTHKRVIAGLFEDI